ncbi:MAG: NADH-quinone oxidoreductase subunit NuoE [Candidatus Marinimicrobia bacterium]|nr:NADH-quinone oxidoreductase subunit NuoE [Candidatus Neomarinimicrobiota bacterium]
MRKRESAIKIAVDKYGKERKNLLPVLQEVKQAKNYLTRSDISEIAAEMDLSSAHVYGVASFYHFLDLKVRGQNIIWVCKTISCYMKGSNDILLTLEEALKIKVGETTSDGKFSLLQTNCIGWCHKGPAMLINDQPYTDLTPEKVLQIIDEYYKKS